MNTLVAEKRNSTKKSSLKKLRSDGKIPAVVYGSDIQTESIAVNNVDLRRVIKGAGRNGIFSLNVDGKSKNVILRDYQHNPVTKDVLHVDFLHVDKDTEIDTKVNVILKGTSNGEKSGGVAKQFLYELDITAKANDLPDYIEIDITEFEIGHSVRVADIKKEYSNCTIKHEDDETIVTIDYIKAQTNDEDELSEVEASGV
ncbi:50S ribosomal protein L25 [Fredinandcohnia sp. QZ13]|uniref:50S ribosomal protein L25 n=1 Tax=Fredinandcohnia sp. QZ13 TaxID=3073144 RepID=UPI002853537B|nr:50S ribosomal protein L25 [Fredinandcohnia sp. QZ13]MDR4888209.1 50S ribosomal protein L25 [Fredinandcohnia sp. QZ13]